MSDHFGRREMFRQVSLRHALLRRCWLVILGFCVAQPICAQEKEIRLGISDNVLYGVNHSDAAAALNVWAAEIARSVGVTLAVQKSCLMPSETLLNGIRSRTVDLACLTVEEYRQIDKFIDSRRFMSDGGTELWLVVNQASGITELSGLKGRRLVIHDNPQTVLADAWLNVLLGSNRLGAPSSILLRLDRSTRAAQAVLPVFFGQADACIAARRTVETMTELNPQLSKQLKVLQASPKMIGAFLVFRKDMPANVKDALFERLSRADESRAAKQVMTLFQSLRFSIYSGDVIRPSLTMITEAERLNPAYRAANR